MNELNEFQIDALGEIFNVGVGRAAASLSQIVSDEVRLSAPTVRLVTREEAASLLMSAELRHFSAVSQIFSGPFTAEAMLIFPDTNALEIVRLMVGPHLSIEELAEYEQETMCEVGNIILNACVSALADMLDVGFDSTLPIHQFTDADNFHLPGGEQDQRILLLQVDMTISQRLIRGHILFLLSVPSLASLVDCLNAYLKKSGLLP